MSNAITFDWVWRVMMADIIIYLALCSYLFSYLKRKHAAEWEHLGSPSLFWNNSPRNNILFLKYMIGGSYRQLGDRTLIYLATAWQILLGIGLTLFFILFVGILFIPHADGS